MQSALARLLLVLTLYGGRSTSADKIAPVAAAAAAAWCPQIDDVDEMSDALLIQGLWAAAEAVDEDEDGPAENADVMLEELAPLQVRALLVLFSFGGVGGLFL
jgi:hypothetical protein